MSNYQTELISKLSYDQDQTNIQQSDTEILSLLFPQNKPAFGGGLGDGFSSSTPYNGRAASQSKDEGLSMLSNFFFNKIRNYNFVSFNIHYVRTIYYSIFNRKHNWSYKYPPKACDKNITYSICFFNP